MFLTKFSYIIIFLWIIFRRNQITGEILNASCARSKFVNLEYPSLDNAYVITSVLNITDTTEILYSFLLRRVLKTKRRSQLKAPLRTSQVNWTKHGQIYLSPLDFHKNIDLTVYMDVESNPGPAESESNSQSTNKVNTAKTSSNEGNITIAHLNIRSLKNKEHYLLVKDFVLKQRLDIFTISETWLDNSITDTEIEFPGYGLFRLDRDGKRGGGVCAYINQSFKCETVNELSYIADSGLHQLWLQIQVMNFRSFFVCTAYRPPGTSLSCFENDFSETLTSALSFNKPIYILGDLNCNVLDTNDPGHRSLLDFSTCFNLTQLVDKPTRITEHSRTLIDVILTSSKNDIKQTKVIPNSISDHDAVMSTLTLKKCRPKPVYVSVRSFKNYNPEAFCEDISNAPNSFVTEEIRKLMRTRDCWRKIARKTGDPAAWSTYRDYKRGVKRKLRQAQRSYVEQEIKKNTKDTGNMWKVIRTCIPKKTTGKKSFSNDDKSVANNFNEFFTAVGSNTVMKIKSLAKENNYTPSQVPFVPTSYTDQFTFEPVECSLIEYIVKSMPDNKAPGIDKVPIRVIKDCLPVIAPWITSIINKSLVNNIFPSAWKIAEVIPHSERR